MTADHESEPADLGSPCLKGRPENEKGEVQENRRGAE